MEKANESMRNISDVTVTSECDQSDLQMDDKSVSVKERMEKFEKIKDTSAEDASPKPKDVKKNLDKVSVLFHIAFVQLRYFEVVVENLPYFTCSFDEMRNFYV